MEEVIGTKFGKLLVLKEVQPVIDNNGSKRRIVEVLCDCGNVSEKKLKYLKSGETTTCGNCLKEVVEVSAKGNDVYKIDPTPDEIEMIGNKYQRWTVLAAGYKQKNARMLKAICECGTEQMVDKRALKTGHSVSCGCYSKEVTGGFFTTHGLTGSPTHSTWNNMIQRCTNEKSNQYVDYGERGISVTEKWRKFDGFLEDMGIKPEGMTLERVDVNGNYCKENCIWADRYTQSVNRRKFKNNKSGKTGVYWNKRSDKWAARITVNAVDIFLGYYEDLELAIHVREEAELKYFGFIKD